MVYQTIREAKIRGIRQTELFNNSVLNKDASDQISKLIKEGKVVEFKEQYYPNKLTKKTGISQIRINKNGNGFVTFEANDYFIHKKNIGLALAGDLIVFELFETKFGIEGKVIQIIKRDLVKIIVRTQKNGEYIDYVPLNKGINFHIRVEPKQRNLKENQLIKLIVKDVNPKTRKLICQYEKTIGSLDYPGTDVIAVLEKHDINVDFSEQTVEQVKKYADNITQKEIDKRTDLRNLTTFTIDGADSKDLDDAISIVKDQNNNIQLYVHIADVSYYVKENTPLDEDALKRGTSIYLVDRVVPMLPPELSNGICSLHPNVDRLTLTCQMTLGPSGTLLNHQIYPSIINSNYRLTYDECNIFYNSKQTTQNTAFLTTELKLAYELKNSLNKKRYENGMLEFEIPEIKIKVDKNGRAIELERRARDFAEEMIEEFMVLANETVAKHLYDLEVPSVYRIHETPNVDKIKMLNSVISKYGIAIQDPSDVTPKDYQKIIEHFKGSPIENVIGMLILRSLEKAKYVEYQDIHFGLASTYYTHFTSPIRRYPDLMIHRLLNDFVFSKNDFEKKIVKYQKSLQKICEISTKQEKLALDCEREVLDIKKAEYMEDKQGQIFKGQITSVNSFGFFVQLPNLVEGLVHVSVLTDDRYVYDKELMQFVGENKRKIYSLGQEVTIKVLKVDKVNKAIDFIIVENHLGE